MGIISRSLLNKRFFDNLNRKLTLVEAPAGYGKTTLMRDWFIQLNQSGKRAIWAQVGTDALQTLALEEQVMMALTRGEQSQRDQASSATKALNVRGSALLPLIIDLLSSSLASSFLFFDDFHECTKSEAEFLHKLILHSNNHVHIVIGTRETLGFPITKLRLEQRVTDFGIDDLRLSRSEVSVFLGSTVSETTVSTFYDYTEGWVAALQLLLQSNALVQPLDIDLRKCLGGQPAIADYINEHFFAQLSAEKKSLLIDTAHLGTVDGNLADHIRKNRNSWDLLAGLAKAHSLVFEVSGLVPGYRYHQLLRDFLLKRQVELGEQRVRDLFQRTAEWCFANDHLTSAIRHALMAKAPERAVQMILLAGAVQIGMKQGAPQLAACLDQIPMHLVHQTPRLIIARSYLLLKNARLGEATRYLDEVRGLIDPADEDTRRELVMVEAHKRLYEDQHLTEEQLASLEHTARITPVSDELMRGIFYNFLCHFKIQAGNFKKARDYGDAAMAIFSDLQYAHLQFFMYLHLSVIDLECGDYGAAYEKRHKALDLFRDHFRHDNAIGALADIYFCEMAFETAKFEGIEDRLIKALEQAGKAEGWSEAFLAGYETCLNVRFAAGGFNAAIGHIAHAEKTATRRASRRFARHMRILELELMLDAGHDANANRLAAQIESMLEARDHHDKLRWRGRVLARLALARNHARAGNTARALQLLSAIASDCEEIGLKRYSLRTEVLRLIVASDAADWSLANRSLKSILNLADPVFPGALIRHAEAFSRAARDCVHNNGLVSYSKEETHKLASLLWSCSGKKLVETNSMLTEFLTEREFAVIRLIARGDANKVIARALDLSEATVKFHVKNIFAKLGVNSRKLAAEIALAHGVEVESSSNRS